MRFVLAIAFFALSAVAAEKVRYDFYQVHQVIPKTEAQVLQLVDLLKTTDYNFWSEPGNVNASVDIMVPPHKKTEFEAFTKKNNLQDSIKIENVQSLIDAEEAVLRTRSSSMDWTNYHTLEEVYKWMDEIVAKYPKIVKPIVPGKSYEGRQIRGLEINFGPNRTGIYLDSGMHAREWLTIATTTFMINEILKGNVDPIFRNFNYIYIPIFNPDGYVYSWTKDRMWTKTRTPYKTPDRDCYGADPNKNYDIHWNGVGTSNDPCHEFYGGPKVFSEVETKTTSQYLTSIWKKFNIDIVLTYHTYNQYIFFPWGHTCNQTPHHRLFSIVAKDVAKAITAVHNVEFNSKVMAHPIFRVTGTNTDWYYNEFRPNIVFFFMLRDKGGHGFVMPPRDIIPSGQEQLAGLKKLLLDYDLYILN